MALLPLCFAKIGKKLQSSIDFPIKNDKCAIILFLEIKNDVI